MRGLAGKSAIVTGAARGIGRAIALRLAEEGMHVTAVDVDSANLKDLGQHVGPGTIFTFTGSVTNVEDMRRCVAHSAKTTGYVDALVNNAGVDFSGSVADTDRAAWDRVHATDLWGPMLMTQCAIDYFARDAAIVNIASTHALATVPNRTAYASAKAGVVGLTRALAVELGQRGIRVNSLLPGYVRTEIWSLWLDAVADPDGLLAKIAARHPIRRLGTPDDVAGAVAFLLSDDASFMTGAAMIVDGGYTAMLESTE